MTPYFGLMSDWTWLVYHGSGRGCTFEADPLRCLSYVPQFEWGGHIYYTRLVGRLHYRGLLLRAIQGPYFSPSDGLGAGPPSARAPRMPTGPGLQPGRA